MPQAHRQNAFPNILHRQRICSYSIIITESSPYIIAKSKFLEFIKMELIKINSSKLKIILSPSDLNEFELSTKEFDYVSEVSKKAFWQILSRAKERTGFDPKGGKLFVQFFPSRAGGGELYITRRANLLPENPGCDTDVNGLRLAGISKNTQEHIAVFCELEPLLSLCRRIYLDGYSLDSTLYLEDDKYYLHLRQKKKLSDFCCQGNSHIEQSSSYPQYLCEYAPIYFADKIKCAYLKEHAKVICLKNAVETFAEKF